MCHLKFFLEVLTYYSPSWCDSNWIQIDEGTCRARREARGEWGEVGAQEDLISGCIVLFHHFSNLPSIFFRSTMIQNAGLRPLNIFARLRGLGILVIGRVWGKGHKRMRESCNCLLFSNLPGVIFLDSTTSTVDQQLVEVLNRVLSHLQVTQEQHDDLIIRIN